MGVKPSHIEGRQSIVRWGRRPHGQAFAENKVRELPTAHLQLK